MSHQFIVNVENEYLEAVCKAIKEKDEKAFKDASQELINLGYFLCLDEEGHLSTNFEGPSLLERKAEVTTYSNNLYSAIVESQERVEEEAEKVKEEDAKQAKVDASFVLVVFILVAVGGFVGYKVASLSRN